MILKILRAAALDRWLSQATPSAHNEIQRFDDHTFAAPARELLPPVSGFANTLRIRYINCL